MSISPFDHPFLSGLLCAQAATDWFSASADIAAMLDFEAALAQAQADEEVISADAARAIATACRSFVPDMTALKAATARDGVVVPELVRQLRVTIPEEHRNALHFGATSQDVIDTSLMIRLKPAIARLADGLDDVIAGLDRLEAAFGANSLMGHTRMQAAMPITVHDRIVATANGSPFSHGLFRSFNWAAQRARWKSLAIRRMPFGSALPRHLACMTRRSGTASATVSPISPVSFRS